MVNKNTIMAEALVMQPQTVQRGGKHGINDQGIFGEADAQDIADQTADVDAGAAGIDPPSAFYRDGTVTEPLEIFGIFVAVVEGTVGTAEI